MIKKITIEAVSIKKANKDGVAYTYAEKDKATRQPTGKRLPRTMVSLKDTDGNWYMGWSYKDGSAAELLTKGQVAELLITQDGEFVNWKFPKQEDRDKALIEELQAKLAATQVTKTDTAPAPNQALTEPPF